MWKKQRTLNFKCNFNYTAEEILEKSLKRLIGKMGRMMLLLWIIRRIRWVNEIQPVHPKGDQSGVFIGRTDVEAETPVLWPPDLKSWLIGKDPDAGKDWGQKEKGTKEDEMVGWHHRLNGHGFVWTPKAGDVQGGLASCSSWGCKESDTTERLNWAELNWVKSSNLLYSVSQWCTKTTGLAILLPLVHLFSEGYTRSLDLSSCHYPMRN